MNAKICEREGELLDALGRGFIGRELEEHTAACESCGELRLVATTLLDDRAASMLSAPVPSAGTMWWRMQRRLRQDLQLRARRSLLIGQAATLAIALGLAGALFGSDVAASAREIYATVRLSTPLLLIVGTWLVLAPIAGFVAIRQK